MKNVQEDVTIAVIDAKWKGKPRKYKQLARHMHCSEDYCHFYGKKGGIDECRREEADKERMYVVERTEEV